MRQKLILTRSFACILYILYIIFFLSFSYSPFPVDRIPILSRESVRCTSILRLSRHERMTCINTNRETNNGCILPSQPTDSKNASLITSKNAIRYVSSTIILHPPLTAKLLAYSLSLSRFSSLLILQILTFLEPSNGFFSPNLTINSGPNPIGP